MAELRAKICALEESKVGNKSVIDALSAKNRELEEAIKEDLTALEALGKYNVALEFEIHELKEIKKNG